MHPKRTFRAAHEAGFAAHPLMLVAVSTLVTSVFTLLATPAAAVCSRLAGDDPVPSDAQYVVVGTVAETEAHGQNALIHVDDVWRGGPLPEWMSLIGTTDPNMLWEDTTQFSVGTRYLVVADREGNVIRPRGCGYTTPYTAAFAGYRPASASSPYPVPRPAEWPPGTGPWVWLGAVAVLVAGALLVGFGRSRVLRVSAGSS